MQSEETLSKQQSKQGKIPIKHLSVYNTKTLNKGSLELLLKELTNIKWDIIGLNETKMKYSDIQTINNGHMLFLSSNENKRANGTGFLVNKKIVNNIQQYQGYSDRLSYIALQGKKNKIHILQA